MYYLIVGIVCLAVGAIGAVIYYRRHVVEIESALAEAKAIRDKARAEAEALKKKVGG